MGYPALNDAITTPDSIPDSAFPINFTVTSDGDRHQTLKIESDHPPDGVIILASSSFFAATTQESNVSHPTLVSCDNKYRFNRPLVIFALFLHIIIFIHRLISKSASGSMIHAERY